MCRHVPFALRLNIVYTGCVVELLFRKRPTLINLTTLQTKCGAGVWWDPNIAQDSMLIAARYEEDVSWMALYLPGLIPFMIYNTKDNTTSHHTPVHHGNEAAAYLQFIVEYYDCLPSYMVFIHAHRLDAEANKACTVYLKDEDLKLLSWGSLPGFASLNRAGFKWHIALPFHKRHINKSDYHHQAANGIMTAWEAVLGSELGPLPEEVQVQGGGQFVVQRDRVQAHPRAFYQQCLTWLADSTELSSWDKGMVFEYTWKLIFGEDAATLDHNVWD